MWGALTSGCTQMALTQGAILNAINWNNHNLSKKWLKHMESSPKTKSQVWVEGEGWLCWE